MVRKHALVATAMTLFVIGTGALRADPLDALDQPISPGEALSHAEIDARYGWLVLAHIDDMRLALRRGTIDDARSIAASTAHELGLLRSLQRDPSSDAPPGVVHADRALVQQILGAAMTSTAVRLADVDTALRSNDVGSALNTLNDAQTDLKAALIALDQELHPQTAQTISRRR
jgi:hypothetical protein